MSSNQKKKPDTFVHRVCVCVYVMISGPARRRRLANREGQRASDWDAIPRRLLKTLSSRPGIFSSPFDLKGAIKATLDSTRYCIAPDQSLSTWTCWSFWDCCLSCHAHFSLGFFFFTATVRRERATAAPSTFCGRASTRVRSAPRTTTRRSSVRACREYRYRCRDLRQVRHENPRKLKQFNIKWNQTLLQCCDQKCFSTFFELKKTQN